MKLGELAANRDQVRLEIAVPHSNLRRVLCERQPRFALTKRSFCLLALRNILSGAPEVDRLSFVIPNQLGNRATREIPEALGTFSNSVLAWDRRIQSGQAGGGMSSTFTRVGRDRALKMYADWTDRIAKGELPSATPQRPQGKERNVVITMWDWADPKVYLHDEIASDKRNPTVNANGPIYGALEASADYVPVIDPVHNTKSQIKLIVRDPKTPSEGDTKPAMPSAYWGDEAIWQSQANAHSFSMDSQGRVWIAARVRQNQTQAFCKEGSTHPSAKAFPINQSGRQIELYDPKTKQMTTVDTCFGTHHLNLDNNDVLWFSGSGTVEGWFNTKVYLETKDEVKAQGWAPFVLDTRWKRQTRRVCRTRPAGRSDQRQAHQCSVLRRGSKSGRWRDMGFNVRDAGRSRSVYSRSESNGYRARGILRGSF